MNRRTLIATLPATLLVTAMPAVAMMPPATPAFDDDAIAFFLAIKDETPAGLRSFAAKLEEHGIPGLLALAAHMPTGIPTTSRSARACRPAAPPS